jgi:hypothetical protein
MNKFVGEKYMLIGRKFWEIVQDKHPIRRLTAVLEVKSSDI